jgi:hypothetical protein
MEEMNKDEQKDRISITEQYYDPFRVKAPTSQWHRPKPGFRPRVCRQALASEYYTLALLLPSL